MLNCTQCADVLPDLLDGLADPILRRRLTVQTEKHERCRLCVESYKLSAKLANRVYGDPRPATACEHLLAFLRARLSQRSR